MSRATNERRRAGVSRRMLVSSLVVALVTGALAVTASGATKSKLTAAQKEAHRAQIGQLNVGMVSGAGADPTLGTLPGVGSSIAFLIELGGENAFHLTSDGVMHPWLVTKYRRIGSVGWAYQVRKGVKFWDGHTMTAADVAGSWRLNAWGDMDSSTPPAGKGRSSFFKNVYSITTPSKYVVLVTMLKPDAAFRTIPSQYFTTIYEKAYFDAHKTDHGKPGVLFMGTGPYIPSNFRPTTGVDWTANPHYWNAAKYPPPFKKIHVTFYADEQSEALAARAGDIDFVAAVGAPATFKATSGGWTVHTVGTCGVGMITMPTQTAPFNDIHVRKAIAYATNRADILKATGGGAVAQTNYIVARSLLQLMGSPSAVTKALKSVPTYPFSLTKAKAEMAQSSVPNGFSVSMEEVNDPTTLNVSQVIAAQLAKIGIKVKVNANALGAWYGKILGPIASRPFGYIDTGACQPDANWEPSLFLNGNVLDQADYEPASIGALMADGLIQTDPAKRLADYVNINKAVNAGVPYIPLYLDGASYASKKYVYTGFGQYWNNEPYPLFLKPVK